MAKAKEVISMLCPEGGWILHGDDFDSITWVDDRPRCTEAEFKAGFAQYDALKAKEATQIATDKAALLAKLGITADEAALLLA